MKKIFSLLVVISLAWAGVTPAHAAPLLLDNIADLVNCGTVSGYSNDGGMLVNANCTDYGDRITIVFEFGPSTPHHAVMYLSWLHTQVSLNEDIEFIIDLESTYCIGASSGPYERYYHFESGGFSPATSISDLNNPMGNTSVETCAQVNLVNYTFIPTSLTPVVAAYGTNEWGSTQSWSGTLTIYEPYYACGEFLVLTSDSYEIDPIIETPLGPVGTPPDDQIYTTVVGQYYGLSLTGGPWNDGTINHDADDIVYSWDGITWEPLQQSPNCKNIINGAVVDIYYLLSESDTFYIRVNDTAGNFANNTNNPNPVVYHIGIGVFVNAASCESQFDYGEGDWVASVQVHADVDGLHAVSALEIGQWYAITVASGTWQDEGTGPERTDMEFSNGFDLSFDPAYTDLVGGSGGVWCQATDGYTTFIQAKDEDLYLRVNNETGGFENNTGTLNVNIYHTAFTRAEDTCETTYEKGDLISTGVVNANQENGKQFAYSVGSATIDLSVGLEPGAWYYLETTGGSWWWKGSIHQDSGISYDMAVSEDGDTWVSLPDWVRGECNVAIDSLGHRGVFFQIPESAAVDWSLRVDDTALWFNNAGSMGWNLYGISKLNIDPSPGQACDFTWSADPYKGVEQRWVDATSSTGDPMYLYPNGTETSSYYAIVVQGNEYYWQEQTSGDPQYGVQISIDNGLTWDAFPGGYAGSLCTITNGHETVTFVKVVTGQNWIIRVDSSSFSDNQLGMGYNIYAANPGNTLDPWTSCFDDTSFYTINSGTYIPVKEEPGIYVNGTNVLMGGDEIQLLQPTETYKLEISDGPWNNGESVDSYIAAISSDNGTTWYAIDDRTNPDIICGDSDFTGMHLSVYFTVQEGQKWKIRVNDTTGDFLDNSGKLAFTLASGWGGEEDLPPVDVTIPMPIVNNVCSAPLVRPDSFLDVSAWVNYARQGIQKYFAWCPEHTNILVALFNGLKTVEPFATAAEWGTALQSLRTEMESYNWTGEGEDFSILDKSPNESFQMFTDRAYAPIANDNPWESGSIDIDSFENFNMPDSYTACQQYLSPQAGSRLAQGVCYASAMFLMTGASFWIQLILDIGIGLLCLRSFGNTVASAISMATGVATMHAGGASMEQISDTYVRYARRR